MAKGKPKPHITNKQSSASGADIGALSGHIQERNKTMSIRLVTSNQTDSVKDMANAKGVAREDFQRALDGGSIAQFLDSLKLTPPEGARLHFLRVRVNQDREWSDVVNIAGPNTPDNYNIWRVGGLYVPTGVGEIWRNLVLLNYPSDDGDWDKALAWGKEKGLKNTSPREAFAIGEQNPVLHTTLEQKVMYVVATTECTFDHHSQACNVWWDGFGRRATLRFVKGFKSSNIWFAFGK